MVASRWVEGYKHKQGHVDREDDGGRGGLTCHSGLRAWHELIKKTRACLRHLILNSDAPIVSLSLLAPFLIPRTADHSFPPVALPPSLAFSSCANFPPTSRLDSSLTSAKIINNQQKKETPVQVQPPSRCLTGNSKLLVTVRLVSRDGRCFDSALGRIDMFVVSRCWTGFVSVFLWFWDDCEVGERDVDHAVWESVRGIGQEEMEKTGGIQRSFQGP
jgi:hypothetical protein